MSKHTAPITRQQAEELYLSHFWEQLSDREVARFQFWARRCCMPFDVFQRAVEKALGRDVFTHEFGLNWDQLVAELDGDRVALTVDEILAMLPADKCVVIKIDREGDE